LSRLHKRAGIAGAAVAAALGAGAYSVAEARRYRLGRRSVPVRAGSPALSILHLSDTHLGRHNLGLAAWLRAVPEGMDVIPDVVAATGDLIDDDSGIEPLIDALSGFEARIGKFYVFGSHDYYSSSMRGFVKGATRLFARSRRPVTTRRIDVGRLAAGLDSAGWKPLLNYAETATVGDRSVRIAGIDDPFLNRHRTNHIARARDDRLAIALVHTPDVVAEWVLAGFDLVLAGHTHGGQIKLPVLGAAVTNCSLPTELASGLHRVGNAWLHVSPGLGTSKFSPVRFMCPPEATLLVLQPQEG
jgi:uncharacterized protein